MPFQIIRNDITKMQLDAIVNPANPMPGYAAGIDSAVYKAAGEEKLLRRRQEIGAIAPGSSFITDGYNLPAKYIIHTVGTAWQGGNSDEEIIIRKCYRSIFKLALEHHILSLAIPLLASGSYGFPKGIALRIALSEIESFMSENDIELYLVVFDEKSYSLSTELYGDIDEYINKHYVEEKILEEYSDSYGRGKSSNADPVRVSSVYGLPIGSGFSESNRRKTYDSENEALDDKADNGREECILAYISPEKCLVSEVRSLEDAVKNLDKSFMELVFSFADQKGLSDVEVQKKANMDRKAFSKLKCGTTKNPSKSTALALAVALELNLDDTKDLLSRAGWALSPCSKQDLIVQYFIEREAYDIYEINLALFEHGEPLLGMQAI